MGEGGGAVFLITYLILIFLVCTIPLIAEIVIGKTMQKDNVGSYHAINKNFRIFGWSNVITTIFIMGFYFVVCGWIIDYFFKALVNYKMADCAQYFTSLTSNIFYAPMLGIVFTIACAFFIFQGLNKGVEAVNTQTNETLLIPCDHVVMAVGSVKNSFCTEGVTVPVHYVGDCSGEKTADIASAIRSAYHAANSL
jgi:SNF family Na+-dependent transporter